MFRSMRRQAQQLSDEAAEAILTAGSAGVLALSGENGYPYAVPLSYVYQNHRIYFHGATCGHKLDAMRREPKASFCVIGQDEVLPEQFTTRYRSVIAFGRMRIITDEAEARACALALAEKYAPGEAEAARAELDRTWARLCLFALDIEHMTGKQGRALMQA